MRLGFAASPAWCSMSSASRWLQSRYQGRRRASRANGSPISASSSDERPTKSRRSSAARCPSGANSGRQAARRVPLAPSGYAYFHNAENIVESLWRALCSGILTLAVSRRGKKGRLCRGVEPGSRKSPGDLRQTRLEPKRVGLAASPSARDQREEGHEAQPKRRPNQAGPRAGARCCSVKKELLSLEEPRRVE